MKNITALAVLVIIFGAFSANNSAFCQNQETERDFCFSFGPQFGFIHGQALEVVYPTGTAAELLSELRWDMKPVFYYGAQFDFGRRNLMKGPGFFAATYFRAGVGSESGVMEDRDWRSIENSDLTNFSSHTNRTNEFYWWGIEAGASVPVKSLFYLKPFLGGSWMRFSFTGKDGYVKYARVNPPGQDKVFFPIDDNPTEYTLSGDVIRYTQDWLIVAAGLTIGTRIFDRLTFDLSFQISPLTLCVDKDEHLATEVTYIDYTSLGLFIEPRGKVSYSVEWFEVSFELAHRSIGLTSGETYIKQQGSSDFMLSYGKAGAGLSIIDTCLLVRVRL